MAKNRRAKQDSKHILTGTQPNNGRTLSQDRACAFLRTDERDQTIYVRVRVTPGAKKTQITEITTEYVRVSLRALPVEGQANTALLEYLSETLKLPKRCLKLVSGKQSRLKTIAIRGGCINDIQHALRVASLISP